MTELKNNLMQMKEINRELYIYSGKLNSINEAESRGMKMNESQKKLLSNSIITLTNQLKILNNSLPNTLNQINIYSPLKNPNQENLNETNSIQINSNQKNPLSKIKYNAPKPNSVVVHQKDKINYIDPTAFTNDTDMNLIRSTR